MLTRTWKRERRVYIFTCSKCGRDAQSYRRKRARLELCRPCRTGIPDNPNQQDLFGQITSTNITELDVRIDK